MAGVPPSPPGVPPSPPGAPPALPDQPLATANIGKEHENITNVTDLEEEIRRLKDELTKKEALLQKYMYVSIRQSQQLASLTTTILHDTVSWDPNVSTGLACSSPRRSFLDEEEEVVVHGGAPGRSAMTAAPPLHLSNRYAVLDVDSPSISHVQVPSDYDTDFPVLRRSPSACDGAPHGNLLRRGAPRATSTIPADRTRPASASAAQLHTRPAMTSARRSLLKDAVLRRSQGLPRPPPPPAQVTVSAGHDAPQPPPSGQIRSAVSSPRPLFAPTTMIVGDSIMKRIRFFNAITHSFPGATVSDLLRKLPGLLESAPESVHRLIIHVGTNDTSREQSEITRRDFNDLFVFLRSVHLSVFISGPIPTWNRGDVRFSRLLSLNTWLLSKCIANNVTHIDNFDLFVNRPSFYYKDGLHPSRMGCHMLSDNFRYVVHNTRE